jgi:hypothetical protein
MAIANVPVTKTAGGADVRLRLTALGSSQRSAVLATVGGGRPYTSLVAFALTPDFKGIVFATPRATAKFRNIRENPEVSLLIDNRANTSGDVINAEALTVMGEARPVRRGKRREELAGLLKCKHPELSGFVDADTTALVFVSIVKAVHVGRFQEVSVWEPGV